MNFEEIWNDDGALSSCSRDDAEDFYNEGAQSQQTKLDELQKLRSLDEMEINQLAQANQVWQIKCGELKKKLDCCREENKAHLEKIDELQARVDEIASHLDINFDEDRDDDQHSYWSGYNQAMRELNDILKGNRDEN